MVAAVIDEWQANGRVGIRLSPTTPDAGSTPSDSDVMGTYGYLIGHLNRFNLSYLHLVKGSTTASRELPAGVGGAAPSVQRPLYRQQRLHAEDGPGRPPPPGPPTGSLSPSVVLRAHAPCGTATRRCVGETRGQNGWLPAGVTPLVLFKGQCTIYYFFRELRRYRPLAAQRSERDHVALYFC